MRAFLQFLGILLSLELVWCDSCLLAIESYVCKEIPTSYPAGLSSLMIWVNNVGEINPAVFNYSNLASVSNLTMRSAGITAVSPGAFDKFQNLKALDLHNNFVSQISSAWFTHKEVLESLYFSNNSIEALNEEAFHGLSGLLRLNLSYNRIQTISAGTLHSLGKLRHLDLSNNKLRYLSVDSLLPLNTTKIRLSGNPWNCSYAEFTAYLGELQRASLLENEMEVICESPACLRGLPVWNVSGCIELGTPVDPTVGYNLTLLPTPVSPQLNWSVLISLIVVLCALVLVICVLSILYHRKRERKHRQSIQPSPEVPERGSQARLVCREAQDNVDAVVLDVKKKRPYYRNEVFLKLDKTAQQSEKVSQIFQIYGSGMCQSREMGNRAKSAGPVLSRADFGKYPATKVEDQKHPEDRPIKDGECITGWAQMEKQQGEGGNEEEFFGEMTETEEEHGDITDGKEDLHGLTTIEKEHPHDEVGSDGDAMLEIQEKYREDPMMQSKEDEESTLKERREFLHSGDDTVEEDDLTSGLGRHGSPQPSHDRVRDLEDSENIPYLTIGTNAENQNPKIPNEASTKQVSSRPIRRVLTWPPTAVQWKKQWTQNQQILNVFPKLIFVGGHNHQIGKFPFSTSSASPEPLPQNQLDTLLLSRIPQDGGSGSMPANKTVEPLKQICESTICSYIQNLPSSAQHYAEVNDDEAKAIIHNALINSEAYSDLVQSRPLCEEKNSKAENEESVIASDKSAKGKRRSRRKKMDPTAMSGQVVSKSERRSRRIEMEGKKPLREGQGDQTGSDSRGPPCGGSPDDDSLLEHNEYAFIDLLHEVVENHGRWTRERWRQSHLNKQKLKQSQKSKDLKKQH